MSIRLRRLALLRRVGGKWGLAPWRKLVWQREKRCRHGACPPFPPGAASPVAEKGTGTVAASRCLGAAVIEATEPVPVSATTNPAQ